MAREHIHFVTGRLAEDALRRTVAEVAARVGFDYSIDVLGITVAALMTTDWIAARLRVPESATRVVLPGYCRGALRPVEEASRRPVERGPKDLRDLPDYFGQPPARDYGAYSIEILAEINHAPQWTLPALLEEADRLRRDGADVIDLGCTPGQSWHAVGDTVRALREAGHRVSIDTFNLAEIQPAVAAGAELVLSVNSSNRAAAADWGCEVVVVPDEPGTLAGLDATIDYLQRCGVPLRVDPILEPIGMGFAASLERYLEVRRRWPEVPVLMGVGNLTELTDADSAAINVLLLGFCQELGIRSVLTTQVINWARSAVRECDLARRLVHYAVTHRTLPKHLEPRLVVLRDPKVPRYDADELDALAAAIRDHNYRIMADEQGLHVLAAGMHLQGEDPFVLFEQLLARRPRPLEPDHAFYLGYEMAKAVTARTLGKKYVQDEALDWGFLTRPEVSHRPRAQPTDPDET
jgi:dihydropteroate synthase-like protein